MKDFLARHFTQLLVVLLALAIGYNFLGVYRLYENDPVSIVNLGSTENYTVAPGDEFTFWRRVCVYSDTVVTVHREFHNLDSGTKYILHGVSYVGYAEDGCSDVQYSSTVPERVPEGRYEYRPMLVYHVNSSLVISKLAPIVKLTVAK